MNHKAVHHISSFIFRGLQSFNIFWNVHPWQIDHIQYNPWAEAYSNADSQDINSDIFRLLHKFLSPLAHSGK